MRPLAIHAHTAISAMGHGRAAMAAALLERRGGLRPCDFEDVTLDSHIGRVAGVEDHRLPPHLAPYDCRNNRLADMALRTDGFADAVAATAARLGAGRIAVILGTSTSGILSSEHAYRRLKPDGSPPDGFDYSHTHDMFSLARFVRAALALRGPAMVVSTACASSARTFLDAQHLIAAGVCDAAVVGGADSLCGTTLYGFKSLDLVAPGPCRPCDTARDGISIGEAAGFALLLKADGPTPFALLGAGTSSDGYHMSAPHPEGAGATAAMRMALAAAGLAPAAIDYVNLHGTGTRANDAVEDLAVAAVLGPDVPCSSTKGWSGHTLGAAGILEVAIAAACIAQDLIPGCLNVTRIDPDFRARTVDHNMDAQVGRVLSNSFGFGGSNCSLVLGRLP